ncbi:hypothetical protein ACOZ4L_15820 (plasmid) [Haloplanus ruber]|uniref:DUF2334 domain-containing protein n=1 Tax=Haloplanus ruber TaxID=869892 RepID=A0ABD6D1S6_9EURY|nr:hypothetical protein [Haloplanus ruber]
MSSYSTPPSSRRGQQTLHEIAVSRLISQFPAGIILRYEADNDQLEDFILGNKLITYVMFNFSDAVELVEEHESLHSYLSNWQVPIVTATEADDILKNRTRDNIRHLLERIQPAIYIPDAGKVYGNDLKSKQRGGLREYRIRVDWVLDEIERQGWEIEILPLAKAMEPWQFKEMLPWYRKHGFQNFAFYARQYYTHGNRFNDLRDHTNNLVDFANPDNIFMIALHGETHLRKLPSRVNGAAGLKQFIDDCNYDNDQFEPWRDDLEANALNAPDILEY